MRASTTSFGWITTPFRQTITPVSTVSATFGVLARLGVSPSFDVPYCVGVGNANLSRTSSIIADETEGSNSMVEEATGGARVSKTVAKKTGVLSNTTEERDGDCHA